MVRTQPMDKADPLRESKEDRPHSPKERNEEPHKTTPAESKLSTNEAEANAPRSREMPYVVSSAPIAPLGNGARAKAQYGSRARLYQPGEKVDLTPAMARHYVKKKLLDPYVPDEDD